MEINEKIKILIKKVEEGLLEREELTRLSFLALFSQESIFMLGQPGVAKSLLARRMKDTIKGAKNFEYLMNRFSTPEEIFGPIKLSKLNEDKFEREVIGYLPNSDIAFLDEIWKASPAIQNTLLTIINEKIYRNGSEDVKVPLKLLVAASNELPEAGAGLEALYDRFMIRYYVDPIKSEENFNKLVRQTNDVFEVEDDEKIEISELNKIYKSSFKVKISDEILKFIHEYRKKIVAELGNKAPYISDRRWKKIFKILRVNATISNRSDVELADLGLIINFIWETGNQRNKLQNIFDSLFINEVAKTTGISTKSIDQSIIEAEKLLKNGFIFENNQISCMALDPHGGRKKFKYYKFISPSNNSGYWIPLNKKREPEVSSDGRVHYYYNDRSSSLVTIDRNRERNTYCNVHSIDSKVTKIDSLSIVPQTKEGKKIDRNMLEKAKEIIDSLGHKIALLDNDIEFNIKKLKKVDSILNLNYIEDIDFAYASIKDNMKKTLSRRNTVLGKVVIALEK